MKFEPLEALKAYVAFPSVSTDPNFQEGMSQARDYIKNLLEALAFKVESIETECHPILLAERIVGENCPHIVLYGHYDVQPPDPLALWDSPAFDPEVREGCLYGRGAADNKGPTIVHISALAQALERNPNLKLNITYVIEGEEEMGSPSMPKFFDLYADRLSQADYLIVSDTGSPSPDQLVVTTALRGLVELEVRVKGPNSDLHSGIYGGAIYNPLHALSEILASLHNSDGSVNVPGFYEGISKIQEWERAELKKYPQELEAFQSMLGVTGFYNPRGFSPLEAVRFEPTLEVNGMGGGYQGEGTKTIIPSEAFAKITCRLVDGQDGADIQDKVINTIKERCPDAVDLVVRRGCFANAYSVDPVHKTLSSKSDFHALKAVFKITDSAITKHFGKPPLYLKEGGSIPVIADFKARAGLDSIMVGLFTPKDKLHAPNESFDLGLMDRAIDAFCDIFLSIGENNP